MSKYRSNCIMLSILILSFFCTILEANTSSIESFPDQNLRFDSLNVRFTGSWPFGGISRGVATDSTRNIMFLGSGGGVYLLDVTNPQNPIKISEQIHTRGIVADLFYEESAQRLYIADGLCGLEIWDITDPVSPYKMGSCDTPDYAISICVLDSFAYVIDNNSLRIINVSTPANPQEVGYCDITGYLLNVYVMGSYAYVTTEYYGGYDSGLVIVDVSTPANPQVIGSFSTMVTFHDVFVVDTYAYVTNPGDYGGHDSAYFHVIDVSDPINPFEVSRLSLGEATYRDCELYVCDTFAYLSSDPFRIINIADPFNPYIVGGCFERGSSVHTLGDYAYVASYPAGLIIDISIPSDPQVVGRYEMPYRANDVYVSAPYAYIADYRKGLYILDISSPANPFEVGNCQIGGIAWSIYTVGDYAYLPYKISWQDSMHLAVIDISDPSNPQQIGDCQADYPNEGGARGIHVLGSYAYIAIRNYWGGGHGGLWIVDVSDPSNPQGVGYFETPPEHAAFGVYVVDTLAFLAADDLYIINVSNPSVPQQIGYYPTICNAVSVYVSGSHAYVVDGHQGQNSGLRVIDVTDPTNPQEVGFCPIIDEDLARVHVSDNYAYVATLDGPRVIDISSPSNPQEVGYYTITNACGVYALYPYVYMTASALGLQIYENLLPGIEEVNVTPIESNHFGATIFSGPLLLPERKTCRVFDITGRVVIPDKIKPGIYFIEIDGVITEKVVKVR